MEAWEHGSDIRNHPEHAMLAFSSRHSCAHWNGYAKGRANGMFKMILAVGSSQLHKIKDRVPISCMGRRCWRILLPDFAENKIMFTLL